MVTTKTRTYAYTQHNRTMQQRGWDILLLHSYPVVSQLAVISSHTQSLQQTRLIKTIYLKRKQQIGGLVIRWRAFDNRSFSEKRHHKRVHIVADSGNTLLEEAGWWFNVFLLAVSGCYRHFMNMTACIFVFELCAACYDIGPDWLIPDSFRYLSHMWCCGCKTSDSV